MSLARERRDWLAERDWHIFFTESDGRDIPPRSYDIRTRAVLLAYCRLTGLPPDWKACGFCEQHSGGGEANGRLHAHGLVELSFVRRGSNMLPRLPGVRKHALRKLATKYFAKLHREERLAYRIAAIEERRRHFYGKILRRLDEGTVAWHTALWAIYWLYFNGVSRWEFPRSSVDASRYVVKYATKHGDSDTAFYQVEAVDVED